MSEFTQFISTVGFPIVMCLLLYYSNTRLVETVSQLTDKINENSELLRHTIQKLLKEDEDE